MSVQDFLEQSRSTSRRETIPPAIYPAVVKSVKIDDRYADTAVVITYELQGDNKVYTYNETFIKSQRFERTRDFYKHLASIGIEDENDFVGCREELDLRWNFTNIGKKELKVVNREFIGFDDEGTESDEVATDA